MHVMPKEKVDGAWGMRPEMNWGPTCCCSTQFPDKYPNAPHFLLSLTAHTLSLSRAENNGSHRITFRRHFALDLMSPPGEGLRKVGLPLSPHHQFPLSPLRFVAFANFPAANGVTICHCYSRCF